MNRTKTKEIGKKKYCVYCGNESISDVDYYNHGREEDHFEKCGCEELKQVRQKEQSIRNIQYGLDDFIRKLYEKTVPKFNKLEYEYKLEVLKKTYEQK